MVIIKRTQRLSILVGAAAFLCGNARADVPFADPHARRRGRDRRRQARRKSQDGTGQFGNPQSVAKDKGMYTGVIIDFDGDGDLDLIGQDSYSGQSRPWLYENLLR